MEEEIFNCQPDDPEFWNRVEERYKTENNVIEVKNAFETRSITAGSGILDKIEKADRFNEGKPKWSLVHFASLIPMIRVLEFGAKKYAPKNWMKPMDTTEILESMQRHLAALLDGEIYDAESGISHMGHIQCNAMFYNYHKNNEI